MSGSLKEFVSGVPFPLLRTAFSARELTGWINFFKSFGACANTLISARVFSGLN
jgi:hypothetical protein